MTKMKKIYRYWFSREQYRVIKIFDINRSNKVLVNDRWREYTECTTSWNDKPCWEDAILLAESEERLPTMIDGVLQEESYWAKNLD